MVLSVLWESIIVILNEAYVVEVLVAVVVIAAAEDGILDYDDALLLF